MDIVKGQILPFYEEQSLPLLRILTDRGSEYCGNPMQTLKDSGTCQTTESDLPAVCFCSILTTAFLSDQV